MVSTQIHIKPNRNKVFINRDKSNYFRQGVFVPEIYTFRECKGTINRLNPDSMLAKEGYTVGQKVIFRQQYIGQILDERFPDTVLVDDESVVAKYVLTKKNGLIIIPRKGWIFGQYIRKETYGSIIMFNGSRKTSYEYQLKIINVPLTYKYNLNGGTIVPLPKDHPPKCLIMNFNHLPHVFVPEKEIGAKYLSEQAEVSLLHLP